MYKLETTKRFDKALKVCQKRGYSMDKLRKAILLLVENGCLPVEFWKQNDTELTLLMLTTGTHSDLFGKTRR